MASKVKFVTCTRAQYDALTVKDDGTLYLLTDYKQIYKGTTLYSIGVNSSSLNLTSDFENTAFTSTETSNMGSATQPVYVSDGLVMACEHTLGADVPEGAVFTDSNDKVTQTVTSESKNYPILFAPTGQTETTTTGSYFGTAIQANPSTGTVTAKTFSGSLSGNASTATALTTSAGSSTQPIYFKDGKPTSTSYSLNKSVPADAEFTDTTYSVATSTEDGLLSANDKAKLDTVAKNANAYSLPTATSSVLGGVKTGSNITNSSGTISITKDNVVAALGYTPPTSNTDVNVTQTVSTTSSNYPLLLAPAGQTATKTTTAYFGTKFQANPSTGTLTATTFSGALSGNASTATALTSSAGSSTQPIYFSNGKPVVTSYSLNKSVPADAEFTDTTYSAATSTTLGLVKSGTDISVDTSGNVSVVNDSHTHSNSTITSLDASKLTGTIDIARLPAGALERLVTVADQAARFALTTSDVQLGDTVQQTDTGVMYMVVDTSKLTSADGYKEYTAGTATSVPWSGITGKPSSYYTLPTATSSTLGGVKIGSNITNSSGTISITKANVVAALGYTPPTADTNTDTKVTQTVSTTSASYPLLLAPTGQTATTTTTAYFGTKFQANPSTGTLTATTFSGSLSGNASTATALTTSAGSSTQPIYFKDGKPVATSYSLAKSVPADAELTDTTYSAFQGATSDNAGVEGLVPAPAAGKQNSVLAGDATFIDPISDDEIAAIVDEQIYQSLSVIGLTSDFENVAFDTYGV